MSQADSTSAESILKDYYTDETVRDLGYEENAFYAMVSKLTSFVGKKYIQPVQYGRPQGRSADSAKALANKTANQYIDFEVTMASDYASHSISRKVIKESATNRGAFFKDQTREIDGMLKTLTRSAAISLYRNGSGAIGRVSATVAPAALLITLMEPEDIVNFEIGQVLVSADNETSGSLHTGAVSTMTVTAVDEDAGTITVNALNTGLGTSDWLFVEGDRSAKISGLLAWIPTSAPSGSDSFFAVNRSVHATRLAGHRLSATGVPIREAIRRMSARIGRSGGAPDSAFGSHQKYRDLELELDSKVIYTTQNVTANIGFTGIKIVGIRKPISVYADHNCPDANMPVLTMDTWKLVSLGPVPDMFDNDGNTLLREVAGWGFEVRADYFANLVCSAPRDSGMLTLE